MPKLQRVSKFDDDALHIVNDVVTAFNSGLSNEDIRAAAGIELSKLRMKVLKAKTILTATTTIRHDLGSVPLIVLALPYSDVRVWKPKYQDSKYVYLSASSIGLVDILIAG